MGIVAGWMILAIILLRLFVKNISRRLTCILWIFVGIRLIFPFSIESIFSLIPSANTLNATNNSTPYVKSGFETIDKPANKYINTHYTNVIPQTENLFSKEPNLTGKNTLVSIMEIISYIWILGTIFMVLYLVINYLKLRAKIKVSICIEKNIYLCDDVDTPFILGCFPAKIYLPSSISSDIYESVLIHEKIHLKRKDHILKFFGFILLSIYWFHPFVWLAYLLMCRDIELACDEQATVNMNNDEKKSYLTSLLNFTTERNKINVSYLAFGEVNVKERIEAIMNHKKTAIHITIMTLIAGVIILICFLTNPTDDKNTSYTNSDYSQTNISEEIPIVPAAIDLDAITGIDGARLFYADPYKIIFCGDYGLFVYDLADGITHSLNLESINCQYTQGDWAAEIKVSNNGTKIYMHQPIVSEDIYIYDLEKNQLTKTQKSKFSFDNIELFDGQTEFTNRVHYPSPYDTDIYVVLENFLGNMGELAYTVSNRPTTQYIFNTSSNIYE